LTDSRSGRTLDPSKPAAEVGMTPPTQQAALTADANIRVSA
jgi:hypothetical protein